MKSLQSYWTGAALTLLLVVAQLLILPLVALAQPSGEALPTFDVPAGSVLLFSLKARGLQNYACKDGQWAFHAPRAELFDPATNHRVGVHYGGIDRGLNPGPWWEAVEDGSRVRAGEPVSRTSPNPDSIPELRLRVLQHEGAGVFSPVDYIQRLNTVGGVGPSGPCLGSAQRHVFYTADYYFYATP